ncbi:MAG: Rab family GTPase [Candidatus Hodarchaeota archaeon]
MNIQIKYKVVVAGNSRVGKTSLVERFTEGTFSETKSTIGVGFAIKDIHTVEKGKVRMQLWDFAGEDRFRIMLPKFCLGSTGAMLVYDLTDPESFFGLNEWMDIIRQNTGEQNDKGEPVNIPIVFIGAKKDLLKDGERPIKQEYIDEFMENYDIKTYFEISNKTGENVEESFVELVKHMIELSSFIK